MVSSVFGQGSLRRLFSAEHSLAVSMPVLLAVVLVSRSLDAQVVINEIHAAPPNKTLQEEFVELVNAGDSVVDISGWYFSNGVEYTFAAGTTLAPGEFIVVAENPTVLTARLGAGPYVGPFEGGLARRGERVILRNAQGFREDVVDYQRGFPWPTLGGDDGYSMELIHPSLANDLGGSWRISNPAIDSDALVLVPERSTWRYFKGTVEPSSPQAAWRALGFNDASWLSGAGTVGYGEGIVQTSLNDMQGAYSTVYLRRTFTVDDLAAVTNLLLEVQYDDGFNAWINGTFVASGNTDGENVPFNGTSSGTKNPETFDYEEFNLGNPAAYLQEGENVLALQLLNASLGGSSDAFIDARLSGLDRAGAGPTPGAQNSVFSPEAPPQLRQLELLDRQPSAGVPAHISIKATDPDGVDSVSLEYQIVEPGSYIRLTDAAYDSGWTSLPMRDDGREGDLIDGDDRWTVLLPESLSVHRRLIRYRITAVDAGGAAVRVPYADDPQPNFAFFVYDGAPSWRGAVQPGATPARTFPAEVMNSFPTYHLIAVEQDVVNSQYSSGSDGVHFNGTLVYEGFVYDHIEFENRGEFSTYVSGKNKWRFHMNRGHEFRARNLHGERYRERWETINFSAAATPWVPTNRGMAALGEGAAFKAYAMAGVPSPNNNWFQFRVIDEALEAHATDQYRGDLWGLYMTIEHTDGAFLDERDLPDGNTYKIEGGNGDKRNQGPTHTLNSSDFSTLRNGYNSGQSIAWWRSNVNLPVYYSFRAVNRAVNNMDLREGWNICQYHHPETGQWSVIPWDLDMLYMPVTHWSGVMNFQNALSQHATFAIEYRNRARELRDLLFNEEQFGLLVRELAGMTNPIGEPLTMVDVDHAMWNYHPRTSSSHRGAFYRNPSTHSARGGSLTRTLVSANHEGMAQWCIDFATAEYGASQLAAHVVDGAIPRQPTVTYIGDPGFPADGLRFRTSDFSDPQGANTFAALRWRAAEVSPSGLPPYDPANPKVFEINAVWETPEISPFTDEVEIPDASLKIGATYRVRAQMQDTTGRTSRWSEPVEFVVAEPTVPFASQSALRVTEIMYNPQQGDDFEYIEMQNISSQTLDLRGVSFTQGIRFEFAGSDVETLGPGEIVLVVRNRAVFDAFYGGGLLVAGEYSRNLSNAGEQIQLTFGANATILDFTFDDVWFPETDGGGYSLNIIDVEASASTWSAPQSWNSSSQVGGTPGFPDGSGPSGGWQLSGDGNQDGVLDISDAVSLLFRLFPNGAAAPLPCDGELEEAGNLELLDANADGFVNVTDALHVANHLFLDGPAPAGGSLCQRVDGCPSVCF